MSVSDKDVSEQRVQEKISELRTKYPIAAAILERIPSMDLKEVVSVMLLVDGVRWLLKIRAMRLSLIEDKVSDQTVEEKINELRTKYPLFAAILERIHNMDLKETTIAMFGIDGMESVLKIRALVILGS
ncbi:MAG: hypothetical protein WCF23_24600 [Candidatus Nitrosopolaris sp.]